MAACWTLVQLNRGQVLRIDVKRSRPEKIRKIRRGDSENPSVKLVCYRPMRLS